MATWLTMQNITFAIAVAGFLMSLASWIHTFITQRKKLRFWASSYKYSKDSLLLYLKIENKSRLPITITRIILFSGKHTTECVSTSEWVRSSTQKDGSEISAQKNYYSMQMPISIPSLGGAGGYVLFRDDQYTFPVLSTPLTLEFHTNRGGPEKLLLPFPK